MNHSSYRPEIDGLRTIAVVAVVLYHAQLSLRGMPVFTGGFIGVDVFFVISGYLITRLILQDLNDNQFSFSNFYMRRARRILPVLFTVILFSLPLAWALMLPQNFVEFSKSVFAAMTMTSNFLFWQQDSYWAVANEVNPLLHTWSLAIEEQFYIIFPPILLLIWRYAKQYLMHALTLAIILSLIATELTVRTHPEAAFYLPYSRAWELGAGALLAIMENKYGRHTKHRFAKFYAAAGLFAILIPVFVYTSQTLHPSLYTALPVMGTCLLIWYCGSNDLVTRILSTSLMVKIGLLSYGWYLWHYPAFAFARIYSDKLGNLEMLGLSLLALVLAWLSYHIIEQPMRNGFKTSIKSFSAITGTAFVVIISFAAAVFLDNGNLGRFTDKELAGLGVGQNAKAYTNYVVSAYDEEARDKNFSTSDRKKIFLIGDSFSQDFYNILREGDMLEDIDLVAHYIPGKCHNVPEEPNIIKKVREKDRERCKNIERVGSDALNNRIKEADGIIVVSRWNNFTTDKVLNLQAKLKKLGGKNILFVGRKNFPKPAKYQEYLEAKETTGKNKFKVSPAQTKIMNTFETIKDDFDHYLDLHRLACGKGDWCPVATPDGYLISHDRDHLTEQGAKYFAELVKGSKAFNKYWKTIAKQ